MQFKVGQKVQLVGDVCFSASDGDIVTITRCDNERISFECGNGDRCSHSIQYFKILPKKTWDTLEVGDILVYKDGAISARRVLAIIDEVVALASGSGVMWYVLANLKNSWTIKGAVTTKQLTLDDIAKKFDIPLDQLRIKDK